MQWWQQKKSDNKKRGEKHASTTTNMKGDNGGDGGDGNININIIINRGLREESHELRSSMRMSNAYMKQLLLEMPVVASWVRPKCRVY